MMPSSSSCHLALCLGMSFLAHRMSLTHADRTVQMDVPSRATCGQAPREVDAAQLSSRRDDTIGDCVFTLKGDEDYFLINYQHMSLECDQSLKIYYGRKASGKPDKEFGCTASRPKSDYVLTKYLTFSFNKPIGIQKFNFSLVATSFDRKSRYKCSGSDWHPCVDSHYGVDVVCIDSDLICDGIQNCAIGSEELECSVIQLSDNVHSLAVGIVITIVVVSILACVGCIVAIVCCCKRRRQPGRVVRQPVNVTVQPPQQMQPVAARAAYPPAGQQPVPSGGYQQSPTAPPGGYQQAPGAPPAGYQPQPGYQPVPTAPPGDVAYPPPALYNPSYNAPPAYPAQPNAPPAYPGNPPEDYNQPGSDTKVPL